MSLCLVPSLVQLRAIWNVSVCLRALVINLRTSDVKICTMFWLAQIFSLFAHSLAFKNGEDSSGGMQMQHPRGGVLWLCKFHPQTLKHSKKGCKCLFFFMFGTGIHQVTPRRQEVHYPVMLLHVIHEAEPLKVTWEAPPFPSETCDNSWDIIE